VKERRVYKSVLFLFGCFTVGYNVSIALHEAGHAFAVLLDGGTVMDFYLNPFSWSWNLGESINNPLFTAWGGVTFGLFFALIPLIFSAWIKNYIFRIIVLVVAGCTFLINGLYLVTGVIIHTGDGGELVQYGVLPVWIILLGSIYLLISLFLWIKIQNSIGIHHTSSLWGRLFILFCGIFPYLCFILIYNLVFNQSQILIWVSFVAVGVVFMVFMAIFGNLFYGLKIFNNRSVRIPILSRSVWISILLGVSIILCELIIFGIRENPF